MDWSNPWVIGPLCTGIGVLVGMFIMRLLGGDDSSAQQAAEELREEFNDYRTSVGQHFATTSELFQDMTEKYRDVYNHMATGAQEFGDKNTVGPRLEIVGAESLVDANADTDDASDQAAETASDDTTPSTSDETLDATQRTSDETPATAADDAAQSRSDETPATAADDAAQSAADETTQATVRKPTATENASVDMAAADEPAPPIDYDAQSADAFASDEVVVTSAASEQPEIKLPPAEPKIPAARAASRWGLKSEKSDA